MGGVFLSKDLGAGNWGYFGIILIMACGALHFTFTMRIIFRLVKLPRTDPYASTEGVLLILFMSLMAQVAMVTVGYGIATQLNNIDYSVYKKENHLDKLTNQ